MDYLITGATGFIGRRLVTQLLALGQEVNYLGRKRSSILDGRAAFHFWKPEESPPLDSISRLDVIVYLAGEPVMQRWTAEVKRRIYASRVEGTRKLVSAIAPLQHKPSVLICASASGYYGDRGDEILTEHSPPGDDFLARLCIDWEREARRASEFGLRVASIRIPVVLGRDGGALHQMLTPFRLGFGGHFGNGRQWMPWVHIDDLVRLFLFTAENPAIYGALNAATPHPVTNAEFVRTLGRALHRPAIVPVPKLALKLAFGEVGSVILSSQRVVPETTLRTGFEFAYPHLAAALKELV